MARNEHATMLRQGLSEWNAWVRTRDEMIDLTGINLRDLDISGFEFPNGVDFTNVQFEHYTDLNGLEIKGKLILINTKFTNGINISDCIVREDIHIEVSYISNELNMENIKIDGQLSIISGTTIDCSINLKNCSIKNSLRIDIINLNGNLICSNSEFHGKVNIHIHKCDNIDLSESTFHDEISFNSCKENKSLILRKCTFKKPIIIISSQYNNDINFLESTFDDEIKIQASQISNKLIFNKARCNNLRLNNVTVGKLTDFTEVIFNKEVKFVATELNGGVNFVKSVFNGAADFSYLKVPDLARFESCTFNNDLDLIYAQIRNAIFKGTSFQHANFEGMEVNGLANYSNCKFSQRVSFVNAKFKGDCYFNGSVFGTFAEFNNSKFSSTTSFENTVFRIAPRFHESTLHQDTSFVGAKFKDTTSKHASEAYRTLKQLMNKHHAYNQESVFFANELDSRKNANPYNIANYIFSFIYKISCNYGQSIMIPIGWLVGIYFYFKFLYLFYIESNCSGTMSFDWAVHTIALHNTLPILKLFKKNTDYAYSCLFGAGSPIPRSIENIFIVHNMLGMVFLFLFIFTIRNRFKIK